MCVCVSDNSCIFSCVILPDFMIRHERVGGGAESQNTDLGKTQELTDPTAEELTKYHLMEMNGSEPELDDEEQDVEEAVPENN